MPAPIHVIAGPTASGKSALAIEKALACDGVIINADALQVYDALPLLTAQPSPEDKAAVPHRLYGVIAPDQMCTVTRWVGMAATAISDAQQAGQVPILVGGTGFYLKGLMEGLSPIPDTPPRLRTAMIERQKSMGNPGFHRAFTDADPVMAARLHPNDTQRLIRAWEVLEATGRSLATWQEQPPVPPVPEWSFHVTIIDPPRDVLYDRCNRRLLAMMEQGAVDEVQAYNKRAEAGMALTDGGVTQALGFRPLQRFLRGEITRDDAIDCAQTDTRQYAKRQVTWLRHQIKQTGSVHDLDYVQA